LLTFHAFEKAHFCIRKTQSLERKKNYISKLPASLVLKNPVQKGFVVKVCRKLFELCFVRCQTFFIEDAVAKLFKIDAVVTVVTTKLQRMVPQKSVEVDCKHLLQHLGEKKPKGVVVTDCIHPEGFAKNSW